jgi:hypothetical protein
MPDPLKRRPADQQMMAGPAGESKTMTVPRRRSRQPRQLDAGPLAADISSFRLHLAAEGKSASPQMLARYGASARSARARRTYDRIMDDTP